MNDLDNIRKTQQSSVSEAERIYTEEYFSTQFKRIQELKNKRNKAILDAISIANTEFDKEIATIEAETGFTMAIIRNVENGW